MVKDTSFKYQSLAVTNMSELIYCAKCRDYKEYLYDSEGFCVSAINCKCPVPPRTKELDKIFLEINKLFSNVGELTNAK